ncbi:uncharacterized protein METZ01_LOCUS236741, partial [marine metagenome]
MNFFEHQEKARKKTGRLVFYFFLAVLCIFGALYAVASFAITKEIGWNTEVAGFVAIGTVAVVGLGSLYKVTALAGGGKVVAESLGGRLLLPNTRDLQEKR